MAMQEAFTTSDIAILVVTSLGILALFIVSIFDRRGERRHKKQISCYSIINEVDFIEISLDNPQYELVKYDKVKYRKTFFASDAYDSIVYSGQVLEFKTSVQNELSTFYLTLKLRNEAIRGLNRYSDRFFIDGYTEERIYRWNTEEKIRYEIPISVYEKYMSDNLDSLRKSMTDELPVSVRRNILSRVHKGR